MKDDKLNKLACGVQSVAARNDMEGVRLGLELAKVECMRELMIAISDLTQQVSDIRAVLESNLSRR